VRGVGGAPHPFSGPVSHVLQTALGVERRGCPVAHCPHGLWQARQHLTSPPAAPALSRSAQKVLLWAKADTLPLMAGALPKSAVRRLPISRGQPLQGASLRDVIAVRSEELQIH